MFEFQKNTITLLNENQGFVTSLLTFAYLLATFFIVLVNLKSVKATRDQTKEMIIKRQQMDRPIISIYTKIINSITICLVIENVGNQPAFNTNIKINDAFIKNIKTAGFINQIQKFNNSSMYLASKQNVYIVIDLKANTKSIAKIPAIIDVSYNDQYIDQILIDFSQYSGTLVHPEPLEDISMNIKNLCKEQIEFQKKLLDKIK